MFHRSRFKEVKRHFFIRQGCIYFFKKSSPSPFKNRFSPEVGYVCAKRKIISRFFSLNWGELNNFYGGKNEIFIIEVVRIAFWCLVNFFPQIFTNHPPPAHGGGNSLKYALYTPVWTILTIFRKKIEFSCINIVNVVQIDLKKRASELLKCR